MKINRIFFVLVPVALYWYLMPALNVASGSNLKGFLTVLLWFAAFVLVSTFILKYKLLKSFFDPVGFNMIKILIFVNLVNVLRGLIETNVPITTALGNPFTALSLFSPLAVVFSVVNNSFNILIRFLLILSFIGTVLVLISFFIGSGVQSNDVSAGWELLYPAVFLIGFFPLLTRFEKASIFVSIIMLFGYIGLIIGSRATIIRTFLLYVSRFFTATSNRIMAKIFYPVIVILILLFAYDSFISPMFEKQSFLQSSQLFIIEKFGNTSPSNAIIYKSDTRTFLYKEVLEDLILSENLIFGKGSSGTYFSEYFQTTGDDTDTRLTVEVGILALILKGGVISFVLNLLILLYASYIALVRFRGNEILNWIGFFLLIHILLLFVENLISFNLYNLCLWIFIGFCLNKKFLSSFLEKHDLL
ncbi:MAG: hypothetical protein ACJLTB_01840 [Algoriphagus aquaeductus]|uniref:hypothetical protein n=1 Tax=Algoriphagus aquaeductus TaxID=475299 RepID=UPI0038794BFB